MTFSTIEQALSALSNGKMIIVVDNEDRENEGDIVVPADSVTAEHVAFMMKHARGLICTPMTAERLDELDIPLMVTRNSDSMQTAFTVSVDYIPGTSTGISAQDRAATIRALVNPSTQPDELSRPGHIFPLRANKLGVLGRPGHTEAAVDLAQLAGFSPAGVICEIANDDGTMARLPQIVEFARLHDLDIITIEDLIAYRAKNEAQIKRFSESEMPTKHGTFKAVTYRNVASGVEHIALTRGDLANCDDVLVRVHSECLTGEAFGSLRCDCGDQLDLALEVLATQTAGCLIYLRGHEGRGIGLGNKIAAYALQDTGLDTLDANVALGFPADTREYQAAAEILRDLNVRRVTLLTNNPEKVKQLMTSGISVSSRRPLITATSASNVSYLRTKHERFGHHFEIAEESPRRAAEGANIVKGSWAARIAAGPLG
ncbi:bifunctional 3,4-dihydroxy-2-butanone-4-phosphate synthase/GTP cyclohydrolase II [Rhizobium laguerreae]|uniref:bifunctional 3,4-dihydroxy-2-butanone-4-phosphate synthase/GTP cyclohydrolase II n=1 Tax=Rhizobium laguerreae TaxID=1076926 RepID=UPI001C926A62|nr:bifunctional 3,4-dihydroxy-2-butanone-4-phosphate synthase/GTP cyclohydrolase II [Rhizobium laguerreae]MBY3468724.1 bifunctional 3,4-dihydroxy-2-butanone-4-phosphate synthase/GTP cyclohydrolase II [Rhizobium laguerreae]